MINKITISVIFLLLITSCASKKDILYLQDKTEGTTIINQDYTNKLQPDDELNILISSSDNEGVTPFNISTSSTMNLSRDGRAVGQPRMLSYIIRKDGYIQFPVIGNVKLEGLTIIEAIELLKQKISAYVVNPTVNIEWINYKFNVLGEVNRPGQYRSTSERVTLLDALAMAGDLDIYGKRKDITLVRDNGKERQTFIIDITQKAFMDSEAYYIKQNDVIIVNPNNPQVQASAFNRNAPLYISLTSTIISLIVLLTK